MKLLLTQILLLLTKLIFCQLNNHKIPSEFLISEFWEKDTIEGSYTIKKFYKDTLISNVVYKNYEPNREIYRNKNFIPFNIPSFDSNGYFINIYNGFYDKVNKVHNFVYTITNYNNSNKLGLSMRFHKFKNNKDFFISDFEIYLNVDNKIKMQEVKNNSETFKLFSVDDNLVLHWTFSDLYRITLYYDRKPKSISTYKYNFEPEITENFNLFNGVIDKNSNEIEPTLNEIEKNLINLYCVLFKISYKLPFDY